MSRYTIHGNSSTSEEKEALGRKLQALNEEARLNIDNDQWLHDRAQEMSNTVYKGFTHENIISLFSNVVNAAMGERVTWSEVRGMKAFWLARGGYIEASSVHRETAEIEGDILGFHVYEFLDKLEANFGETAATLIDLGIQRMDAAVNQRFLTVLQAAVGSGHPNYHSGSGVSIATISDAIAAVEDASDSGEIAIVGRPTMTRQIMHDLMGVSYNGSGFIPETNEDMVRRGVLGSFLGANIVALKNYKDENNDAFFPANELFVVAPDSSTTVFWGGLKSSDWVEQELDYWHYRVRREVGMVVRDSSRLARVVDTSIAA